MSVNELFWALFIPSLKAFTWASQLNITSSNKLKSMPKMNAIISLLVILFILTKYKLTNLSTHFFFKYSDKVIHYFINLLVCKSFIFILQNKA